MMIDTKYLKRLASQTAWLFLVITVAELLAILILKNIN